MPLYPSAKDLIGIQLDLIARDDHVRLIVIGELTAQQHQAINQARKAFGLPSLESPELVYVGKHHFKSRVTENGYALHDLFEQIAGAFHETSSVHVTERSTTVVSTIERDDGYGCKVKDVAVLELNSRKPRAEVYSVVPKGDRGGPKKRQGP